MNSQVGETQLNVCDELRSVSGRCGAIIDSGTTFIGVPQK